MITSEILVQITPNRFDIMSMCYMHHRKSQPVNLQDFDYIGISKITKLAFLSSFRFRSHILCCRSRFVVSRSSAAVPTDRILPKLPLLSTNGAGVLTGGLRKPFADTLEMKGVRAPSPYHRTILARKLDSRSRPFKGKLTDSADIIVGVPTPVRYAMEALNAHLEARAARCGVLVHCCCC